MLAETLTRPVPPDEPLDSGARGRSALRGCDYPGWAWACLGVVLAAGCTSYPIHAMQTDAELAATLSESFWAGMPYDEVNATLTELRVSEKYRHTYAGSPPREMLARVFRPGGFWLDRDIEHVRWVDLTFSFDEADTLAGLWTSRGGARYVDGWPITITPSPFLGDRQYYPAPPPPPVTPPRENGVVLPGS